MDLIKKMFGGAGAATALTCEKCGKEKTEDQGKRVLGGSAFCCDACCGEKTEKKESAAKNVCEFC